jgi:DNA helicase HerA-like ATPase
MPVDYQVQELKFGHVQEIDGHSVTILADKLECKISETEYAVELGSFINLAAPKSDLIAVVSGIKVVETPGVDDSGKHFEDRKLVIATLVGFLKNGTTFERGIERYPVIGTEAYLLTEEAMTSMFKGVIEGGIPIGTRCQRGGGKEFARVDKLFGRHTAVLGTTGSGKSWTVASLLQNAMQAMPHTRLLFLDLHDEYRSAFPTAFERLGRKTHHIPSQDLKLPYWCLNADELEELFVSREHVAQNQSALFKSEIRTLRTQQAEELGLDADLLSVDTPVYFSFDKLLDRFNELNMQMVPGAKSGQKQGPWFGKLSNLVMRMEARKTDPRFGFLFPEERMDNQGLNELFEELLGFADDTQMTIVDLSGLPSDVLSVIVGILCRLAFEYKYWDVDPHNLPLTIVLEEAHNYLPNSDLARHRICLERVERVAKEGRKYGVSLLIISQRPSELSETVLSQCANFIAMRLTNPNDQMYVRKLLPDFLAVSVDMLPYLRTGEAVFAGEAVELPIRVRIEPPPDPQPKSHDVKYLKGWTAGVPDGYAVEDVVTRWRKRER